MTISSNIENNDNNNNYDSNRFETIANYLQNLKKHVTKIKTKTAFFWIILSTFTTDSKESKRELKYCNV